MKVLKLIFLSIFLAPIISAQTIDKLDTKNGFKEFTLGDPFTKWQSQCEFEDFYENGTKGYTFIGECCNKVFNYEIDQIILRFYSDTLVGIDITSKELQKSFAETGAYTIWRDGDIESIRHSLSNLFGEATGVGMSRSSGDLSYEWVGEKVYLFLQYNYFGPLKGDRINIRIISLDYLKSSVQEEF